jgi:predicted signal transduction protein with EAL and GGDEF domain
MRKMLRAPDDFVFVQALVDLAKRLNMKTVAEWVQNEGSASLLADWGCDSCKPLWSDWPRSIVRGAAWSRSTVARPPSDLQFRPQCSGA